MTGTVVWPAVGTTWKSGAEYEDIRYELAQGDDAGIAKITIDRPEVRNAFRPETVIELIDAFERAREDPEVGVIILTGEGDKAFCSGGDQRVRAGKGGGYVSGADPSEAGRQTGTGRFHVTDLHVQIRRLPKPVVAMVAGYAIGGGHVLHVVCDLTIAAENARFGQTGPAGRLLRRGVWRQRALSAGRARSAPRRSGFCAASTTPQQALQMGLVNAVVPLDRLEAETVAVVPGDAGAVAVRPADAQGQLQRGRGRAGRDPAAGP